MTELMRDINGLVLGNAEYTYTAFPHAGVLYTTASSGISTVYVQERDIDDASYVRNLFSKTVTSEEVPELNAIKSVYPTLSLVNADSTSLYFEEWELIRYTRIAETGGGIIGGDRILYASRYSYDGTLISRQAFWQSSSDGDDYNLSDVRIVYADSSCFVVTRQQRDNTIIHLNYAEIAVYNWLGHLQWRIPFSYDTTDIRGRGLVFWGRVGDNFYVNETYYVRADEKEKSFLHAYQVIGGALHSTVERSSSIRVTQQPCTDGNYFYAYYYRTADDRGLARFTIAGDRDGRNLSASLVNNLQYHDGIIYSTNRHTTGLPPDSVTTFRIAQYSAPGLGALRTDLLETPTGADQFDWRAYGLSGWVSIGTAPDYEALTPEETPGTVFSPMQILDLRAAIQAIASSYKYGIGSPAYDFDAGSPYNLYYLAMGDRQDYGATGGARYTWTRGYDDMVGTAPMDIDIGEIYECVELLKNSYIA